jgi:hypothetical protein
VPLVRYFLLAGSALLALLLMADWYWPAAPAIASGGDRQQMSLDKEILRIRSAQRWPQKIVFDTNLPTIVPPQPAVANVPAHAAVTPVAEKSTLGAFAEMKPVVQPQGPPRKKVAKQRTLRPAPARVAAYPAAPAWSWNW